MSEHQGAREPVSRRQRIKRGMLAGGVVLWATPVAAIAQRELRQAQVDARAARLNRHTAPAPTGAGSVTVQQQTSPCTGYPPGTCLTFECGQSPVQCGDGAGGFICFCDVDSGGNCVCVNDAFCNTLPSCSQGCPPGWFCIPTSCCGVPKCAPPCGTSSTSIQSAQFGIAAAKAGSGAKASGR